MTSLNSLSYEQNRQTWIAAFGLTPWVAKVQLAAAPSPLIELPQPKFTEAEAKDNLKADHQPSPVNNPKLPDASATATAVAPKSSSSVKQRQQPAINTEGSTVQSNQATQPKPAICLTDNTLIVVEQGDRLAPGLSREEQQLFHSLQHLYGSNTKHFSAICPVDPNQAQISFDTFVSALTSQGCQQVLLCLSDSACQHMLGKMIKYQRFTLGGINALVVASLEEMRQAPLQHKKKSWQAMREANFVR